MPKSLSHNFVYRSSLRLTYASQLLTGIVLTFHYVRSFDGLIIYCRDTEDGLFLRYMHANGASLFLFLMFCHTARGFYYNSSNKSNLWASGVIILLLSMGIAFMGYVLPYGQMSYWGATVIINLLSVISFDLCILIWGRFVVSVYTLTRFYTFHFLLPLVLAVFILAHLHLLHGTGGSSLFYSFNKLSFFPYFIVKDGFIWSFFGLIFLMFVCIYPNLLGDAENFIFANPLVTPVHIKPEWYFLFAYAILRCIPNKTMGVLALALSVAVPIVMSFGKRSYQTGSLTLLVLVFTFLTVFGRMPIVSHYYLSSQILSLFYFFLVLLLN